MGAILSAFPGTQAIGMGLTALGAATSRPVAQPGTGFTPFGSIPLANQLGQAAPILGGVAQAAAALGPGLYKIIKGVGGAARSVWKVVLPSGKVVTRKNAVALAKRIGVDAAALALGISAAELASAIAEHHARPRRSRGTITRKDLATVRRTSRKLNSALCALASIPRPSVRRRAAGACAK